MNTDTGRIYTTDADIQAAKDRGEPIAMVSKRVADLMSLGIQVKARMDYQKHEPATEEAIKAVAKAEANRARRRLRNLGLTTIDEE